MVADRFAHQELLRPAELDTSGRRGWEWLPGMLTRPALRLLLAVLGIGLTVLSRIDSSTRSQVTRTLSFDISTADGVHRRWLFDGRTRYISSTTLAEDEPDHRLHFGSSGQALGALTSPRAVDAVVAGLVGHRMQLRGSAFIVIWFYGLTRRIVAIGRTRGPKQQIPGAYLRPDPSRDGPESIIREPAVDQLDPTWSTAWDARTRLWMVRGPGGEPMPEP
ncbi:hypothetical protein [Pseudonocardia spinosispora]|uniref:hypothetical protein n=1 Tax=Pseudonocardia spinosispora TaxID=103441 RepID=UPI00040F255A|nr:hypothetical protein [Pseudonocardia spinosispora]